MVNIEYFVLSITFINTQFINLQCKLRYLDDYHFYRKYGFVYSGKVTFQSTKHYMTAFTRKSP